jgi:hypothetical protein
MTNSLISLVFGAIIAGVSYFSIGPVGALSIGLICFLFMLVLTTFAQFSGIKISKFSSIQKTRKQHLLGAKSELQYE